MELSSPVVVLRREENIRRIDWCAVVRISLSEIGVETTDLNSRGFR